MQKLNVLNRYGLGERDTFSPNSTIEQTYLNRYIMFFGSLFNLELSKLWARTAAVISDWAESAASFALLGSLGLLCINCIMRYYGIERRKSPSRTSKI
jgi:hypothetical protein